MKCYMPRLYKFPVADALGIVPIVDSRDQVICWAPNREAARRLARVIRAHMPESVETQQDSGE